MMYGWGFIMVRGEIMFGGIFAFSFLGTVDEQLMNIVAIFECSMITLQQ